MTYYYNRLTKDSVWEKPAEFDGYEIMTGMQARRFGDAVMRDNYERTFGLKFATATPDITHQQQVTPS